MDSYLPDNGPLNHKFECLPPSRVSSNARVVVLSNNAASEFSVLGYVDPILEKN
jgi:hypothetical protein